MARIISAVAVAVFVALITVAPGFTSAKEGRVLVASFVGPCQPGSQPISLSEDGSSVISLRPGVYWITMTDDCTTHNFTLANDVNATDGDELTGPVGDTPGAVTMKIQFKHGTYKLFCSNPRHTSMKVIFEVGGVGQTDS